MRKIIAVILLFALSGAMPLMARKMDRGLGDPKSVYISKGSFAAGISAGYGKFSATGDNASSGASVFGLVTNLNGNANLFNASASGAWFFRDNMSVVLRLGYNNVGVDLNNANLLIETMSFSNKHVVDRTMTAALGYRAYIPLFNTKILALFAEGRLTGGFGFSKDYAQTDRGKEGTYADIFSLSAGLYPGVSVFVTDFLALELSLPLVEVGYKWNDQTTGQAHDSRMSHWFANLKPDLLGLNLGIVFHF